MENPQPTETDPFLGKKTAVEAADGRTVETGKPSKEATEPTEIGLKKNIGLFSGCSVVVGVIIGSGIFLSPIGVLQNVGSGGLSIGIWLLCGLYSLFGAISYAELGAMITKSGGDYTYILEAFGGLPAFLFLWISLIVVNPTVLALIGITCGQYMLVPFFGDSAVSPEASRLVGASIICVLIVINCISVKLSTWISKITTIGKVAALIMLVISAIIYLIKGHTGNINKGFFTDYVNYSPSAIALGFYSGVFSYSGWNYLNFLTEELKEPTKNLPRAIYISIPFVTIIYILVNMAYLIVLTPPEVVNSNAVAMSVAERALGPAKYGMPVVVALSCIGTLNGMLFACSRMFFVAARNGHLPLLFAMIHPKFKTPIPSIILLGSSGIFMHFFKDLLKLINVVSFGQSSIVLLAVVGLIKMRFTDKDRPRPIKVFIGIPILFILVSLFILVCPFFQQPTELVMVTVVILSGIPVYFLFVFWKNKPKFLLKPWIALTHGIQGTLLCIPQDEREN